MKRVMIKRLSDASILRASIEGDDRIGYYCSFRGDQAKVIDMLETVLLVLRYAPQMEVEVDTHERYFYTMET